MYKKRIFLQLAESLSLGLEQRLTAIESLTPFAEVDISGIPIIVENNIKYYLLSLEDYLKVYTASSKDG